MTEGHVFIAATLDGFVARPDGSFDFLMRPEYEEDHGYTPFMARMDGLLMGRGTLEAALGFPSWPYEKPVVALSRSMDEGDVPKALRGRLRIWNLSPREALARLGEEGWRRAYVDGGQIIQSCLRDGLIAEMIITRVPVLIGAGRPLFGPLAADVKLAHLATTPFPNGLVQSHYRVSA